MNDWCQSMNKRISVITSIFSLCVILLVACSCSCRQTNGSELFTFWGSVFWAFIGVVGLIQGGDPAILDTARAAAAHALKTDPAYRQAVATGDREVQQKVAEVTTRAMIISQVQATFNPLQQQLDAIGHQVLPEDGNTQ